MKDKDEREIYSIPDIEEIIENVLSEELGLGTSVINALKKQIRHEFQYINWIRFQRVFCGGCVSSPEECEMNRNIGVWKRIVNGEKFTECPFRTNGTFAFDVNSGAKVKIDLSEGETYTVVEQMDPID